MDTLINFWRSVYEGLPPWPRVVMAFLMFILGAVVVLLSVRNVIVYDVIIRDKNAVGPDSTRLLVTHNVGLEQPTAESGWVRLALASFPVEERLGLGSQRSTIRIKKPFEPGKPQKPARYEFTTGFLRSRMVNFELSCDFDARDPTCEIVRAGDYQDIKVSQGARGRFELAMAPAHAAPLDTRSDPEEIAPSIETLKRTLPDGGFTEIRLTFRPAVAGYCNLVGRCPDVLYFDVQWNGRRWLFDGTEPVNSRERNVGVTVDGRMGDLLFGIHNSAFQGGENVLRVSAYSRGELSKSWLFQQPQPGKLLDVVTTKLELFCKPRDRSLVGGSHHLQAALETVVRKDRLGRDHQVVIARGTRTAIEAMRKAFDDKIEIFVTDAWDRTKQWVADAVANPPSPCRADPSDRWTLLLGVRQESHPTRVLLAKEEARELAQKVRSQSRNTLASININPQDVDVTELHQR